MEPIEACPSCGYRVPVDVSFCPGCGASCPSARPTIISKPAARRLDPQLQEILSSLLGVVVFFLVVPGVLVAIAFVALIVKVVIFP